MSIEVLVPKYYSEYVDYVNTRKMIPNMIDGLLPVQKRILLTLHTIAKNKYEKTAKVTGECMANWHPHSPADGTCAWAVHNGFADGDGQWGSKFGIEESKPAASRYTKIKANNFIEEMAFKYINYVPWRADELDPEPVVIPTMIPFCLFTKYETNTIASGFKVSIPNFKFSDLVDRLFDLLDKKTPRIIYPNIIGCKILSTNDEINKILTKGKGTITVQGLFKKDPTTSSVEILGWAPRCSFEVIRNKINSYKSYKLFDNNEIGFRDLSTTQTKVRIEVNRTRNKEETYKRLCEAVENALTTQLKYEIFVVDVHGKVVRSSVDNMLLNTYKFYQLVLKRYFLESIKELDKRIEEYDIIIKIREYLSDLIKKFQNDSEKIIDELVKITGIEKYKIKEVMNKYKINKVLSVKLDKNELELEKKQMSLNLQNIEKYAKGEYENVRKKA